jgi:hypothetical protein
MLRYAVILVCFALSPFAMGKEIVVPIEEGNLKLVEFLDACDEVAKSTPSKRVHTKIPGKVVKINSIPYEVRFFSFEDTTGKFPKDTTFREYAKQSNLLTMKSARVTSLPGVLFETFDFRRNPAKDGVYFSMGLRKIDE